MSTFILTVLVVMLSILLYGAMIQVYVRFPLPFLMPAVTSTCVIIASLLILRIPYETYMIGAKWIHFFLGPSVVSLAYPLYKHWELLKKNWRALLAGITIGAVTGMVSGVGFARLLGFSQELVYALLPKSITTPVAMQIAMELNSIPSLAAVFVMIAGFSGVILGPYLLRWLRIDSAVGRGIGFGTASHAIGTAKATEYSQETVSVSSVAMTVSAVIGSFLGPFVAWLFYL
ncbi:LrgB family protein [Paenibacillus senegalensis]|uniref:LrgB family protein n=1 Tax=Paenibacillus senegalensis TaxID=1465766 RepID=UPI0002898524|nr:LrgB family protein [Paenibacillus senegalensis]